MELHSKKRVFKRICIICMLLFIDPAVAHPDDEIHFFNVGQGHAVLIKKGGINETTGLAYVPLLVDAGSTVPPFKAGERYDWIKDDISSLSSQIAKQILYFWKESHGPQLKDGEFGLNIIVTHPDKDHQDFILSILKELESEAIRSHFIFNPLLLLGGTEELYHGAFKDYKLICSNMFQGLILRGNLGFLDSSGCITHLFCPKGIKSDPNRWSIITRVQLDRLSAVFTGDANDGVKSSMLTFLPNTQDLQSDILHIPHHGAEGTYLEKWDEAVNPKAIVISSGLHNTYKHPRGTTILNHLNLLKASGHIWEDKVIPHAMLYYCNKATQEGIGQVVKSKGKLFDVVPPNPDVKTDTEETYHLVWTDIPVYTLWSTGTIVFKENVRAPSFKNTTSGISPYIAVPNPLYLFDPYSRERLVPLSDEEQKKYVAIPELVRKKFKEEQEKKKQKKGAAIPKLVREKFDLENHYEESFFLISNLAMKELLLIQDHEDRELYWQALERIFSEIKLYLYIPPKTSSFRWLREAIVERNRNVPKNEERFKSAVKFLFRSHETLEKDGDSELIIDLCYATFERNTFVLKTFLNSNHSLDHLKKYVTISSSIGHGFSAKEMEILCPFGFPEWLQFEKLVSFVRQEIINPAGEPISVGDVFDVFPLRLQGKNFKEITKNIFESDGFIQETQKIYQQSGMEKAASFEGHPTTLEEFYQKLEEYFPKAMDEYLT